MVVAAINCTLISHTQELGGTGDHGEGLRRVVLIYFKFDPHISHLQTLATSSSFPLGHHVAQALCLSVPLCPILLLLGVPLTIRIFFLSQV